MATRVDRAGIEGCITKVNTAIEQLRDAASTINSSMSDLPEYWEGAAYDKANSVYEEEYKDLLTQTVPEAVESFKEYINQCMEKIIELDEQLAGN
ncbi:MAG TPA: hypothetical protein IAB23_11765 [Candidatus Scybalocola faecavium]|nr:hypothetical protein [Candidatus Scybalocola faecavium]